MHRRPEAGTVHESFSFFDPRMDIPGDLNFVAPSCDSTDMLMVTRAKSPAWGLPDRLGRRAAGSRDAAAGISLFGLRGGVIVQGMSITAKTPLLRLIAPLFGVSLIQLAEPFARRVLHEGAGKYGLLVAAYVAFVVTSATL